MSIPDFSQLMEKAQGLQSQLKKMQEEAENTEVEAEAGAGMVKVKMKGNHLLSSVTISDEAWQEGKTVVNDLILSAVNSAVKKVAESAKSKMSDLPNLMG